MLMQLPSIYELELSSLLLISNYCKLVASQYNVLEQIIQFLYTKLPNPELEYPCASLFNHLCRDCSAYIIENMAFTGSFLYPPLKVEQLLNLHTNIPAHMSGTNQCTVGLLLGKVIG